MLGLIRGFLASVMGIVAAGGCVQMDDPGLSCWIVFPGTQEVRIGETGRAVVRNACSPDVASPPYLWTSINPQLLQVQKESDSTAVFTGLVAGTAYVEVRATAARPGENGSFYNRISVTVK